MANLSSLFKSHRGPKEGDAAASAATEPSTATEASSKSKTKSSRSSSPDKKKKSTRSSSPDKKSSLRSPSPDKKKKTSSRSPSPDKKKKTSRSLSPDKKSKHKKSVETTTSTSPPPSPTKEPKEEVRHHHSSSPPNIHKLVNKERLKRQLPLLGRSKAMDRMAQQAVDKMAKSDDVMAGLKLTSCQRLAKSLNTSVVARNVEVLEQGGMYDEGASIKQLHKLTMEKGSASRDKILNDRFEATGMAMAVSRKTGNMYLVQIFRGKLKRAAVV
eukprot:scaffold18078_cov147-Amphora_coffeaeformis.AAC.4